METPNTRKRKRQTITLADKQTIIEAAKTRTTAQLVKHFNNKYADSTIVDCFHVNVSGFSLWLLKDNTKLRVQQRKILLFIDNCPAHPKLRFSNIELKFFLPNATAEIQPMDQGIIQNLKVHYRRRVLRRRIAAIDAKTDFEFNLLDSINLLKRAWNEVKPETLKNCFRKAGFHIEQEVEVLDEADNVEVDPLWAQLQSNGEVEEGAILDDFLNADQDLATTGIRTLEDIVESVQEQPTEQESENEAVDAEAEPRPPVTRQDAYKGFDQLRRYIEENAEDPKAVQFCHYMEDFLHQEQMKHMVQAPITEFMSVNKPSQSSITQFFA